MVFLVTPCSKGRVALTGIDPEAAPRIEPRYLRDPECRDARALEAGLRLLRRIAATEPMRSILLAEADDSRQIRSDNDIAAFVRANVIPYEHPVGTCRMGRPDDPDAVTSGDGLVRQTENIVVADASIMPAIPGVPINLTCMMIGWRLAETVLRIAGR